jgi:hypothetical protein
LLIAALAFGVGSVAVATATPSEGLQRPLRLPHVAPNATCPVTHTPQTSPSGQPLSGSGSAFLMSVGASPAGVISIDQSTADSRGWRAQKTPWYLRGYGGPLLIRGGRLDGAAAVRFAKVYGQHLRQLRFRAGESNGTDGKWRLLASASLFRVKGCYGFQIDGTTFSRVVVMRVI